MADDQEAKTEELDRLHDDLVDSHKEYLKKIQEAFNKHCEKIGTVTQKKLAQVPDDKSEESMEKRKKILEDEQRQLDVALAELKQVVSKRDSAVRKKLEEIENQRDANSMDLEAELANL